MLSGMLSTAYCRWAPAAVQVRDTLQRVLTAYDKRSELIQKLVAAAETTAEATARHEAELAGALRERDAAQAEMRRHAHLIEQGRQDAKVCSGPALMNNNALRFCECTCMSYRRVMLVLLCRLALCAAWVC